MIGMLSMVQEAYVAAGFGERDYHNTTTLYPIGLAVLAFCALAMFIAPRRYAIVPLIALESIVPTAQRIVVGGLDWNFGRILVLVGLLRILARGEYVRLRLIKLDKVILAWAIVGIFIYTARRGSTGALIYKLGLTVDTLGIYALGRVWIRDLRDVDKVGLSVSLLGIFAGGMFLFEHLTSRNLYSMVGGVSEITQVREGRLRCQGPFKHPILAGVFWVSLLPWVLIRWWTSPGAKLLTVVSAAAILLAVFASSSSTPLMGLAALGMGSGMFVLRRRMRLVRWATVFTLLGLHLVMNKPVWHLITRINVVGGSTGYHRYRLINAWVDNWKGWVLLGTKSTASWGWYLFDVTNQFIKESIDGGGLGFLLFVGYFSLAFSYIGRLWRVQRSRGAVYQLWGLGVCIFIQCVMFIGVGITHAQQNLMCWLLPISACAGLWSSYRLARRPAFQPAAPAGRPGVEPRPLERPPTLRGATRVSPRRLWREGEDRGVPAPGGP